MALLTLALVRCGLRRRLELVAQRRARAARPALTAVALGVEDMARFLGAAAVSHRLSAGGSGLVQARARAAALEGEVGRLRLALEDLGAARRGTSVAPRPERLALEAAVRASARSWEGAAQRAGGGVSVDWRAGPVRLEADPRRLSQALGNVLSNAVGHGGGRVRVVGRRTPDGVRVEVADGGPGFEGAAPPDRAAGHGRGLEVAARAVREAGGRMRVDSRPGGSVVALELPAADG